MSRRSVSRMVAQLVAALFVALAAASPASAQVGQSMSDFFDDSKMNFKNTTPPGLYKAQSVGVFTMGSVVWRAPQTSVTPFTIQGPDISAGCGGIDAHFGGFSFISGDEIDQLFKAIVQNAEGFAVSIALDLIDPQIKANLDELMEDIQWINDVSIESCDAAAALVGGLGSQLEVTRDASCRMLGTQNGTFSDWAEAKSGCSEESKNKAAQNSATPDQAPVLPTEKNYAYEASSSYGLGSKEMRELLMAISGTIIIQNDPDGGPMKRTAIPPMALDDRKLSVLLYGGDLKIFRCDADVRCLAPTEGTVTIPASQSFANLVSAYLVSVNSKVRDGGALTPSEISFVEETMIPVLAAVKTFNEDNPETSEAMILSYTESIAMEMLIRYLLEQMQMVRNGAQDLAGADQYNFSEFMRTIDSNLALLEDKAARFERRARFYTEFVQRLESMDAKNSQRVMSVLVSADQQMSGGRDQ